MNYESLEHTADLKIRAFGKDKKTLFKNALEGMFKEAGYRGKGKEIKRKVEINSPDLETLLVDFLSEALYLSETNHEVYFDLNFNKLTEREIEGSLIGKKLDNAETIIKGVTYHDLKIAKKNKEWEATILFDI